MKRFFEHTALIAALLLSASCLKVEPDFPVSDRIDFMAGIGTKAIMGSAEFEATAGSSMKVYDIYTSTAGEVTTLIDNSIISTSTTNAAWAYADARTYYWTHTGTHQFFGWLLSDGNSISTLNASNLFGSDFGYNAASKTISVPATTLDITSPQFDFMYSGVITRDAAVNRSVVALDLKHLFTAFRIGAKNTTENDITITSVQVCGLKNRNNAQIVYTTGTQASVNCNYGTASHTANFTTASSFVLPAHGAGNVTDIFGTTDAARKADNYRIMWPHAAADFDCTGAYTYSEETGYEIIDNNAPIIIVDYVMDGVNCRGVAEFPKATADTYLAWEAGKKYNFSISFSGKQIALEVNVQPWEYENDTINYDDGTVSLVGSNGLSVPEENNNCVIYDKDVYFTTGAPITANFRLATPLGATWMVSLAGETPEGFELLDKNGNVTGVVSGQIDGVTTASFKIRPRTGLPLGTYKVSVSIAVKLPNGRVVSADDVAQGANRFAFIYQNL